VGTGEDGPWRFAVKEGDVW